MPRPAKPRMPSVHEAMVIDHIASVDVRGTTREACAVALDVSPSAAYVALRRNAWAVEMVQWPPVDERPARLFRYFATRELALDYAMSSPEPGCAPVVFAPNPMVGREKPTPKKANR
jgi:hypothetical protein